jgi:fructokinase
VADALVVGESIVDVVVGPGDAAPVERAGGSAANVAVALARLGRPVRFATAFADDDHGRLVASHLAASGVTLAGDPHVVTRTPTARATISPEGAASYDFDIDWRLGPVSGPPPSFLHVCSLGAVLEPGCDDVLAVLSSLGPAAFVTYDVNARPVLTGTGPDVVARVEAVARHADLVKASDEDLEALWPDLDLDGAAAHLLSLGASVVVVTRGVDGSRWYDASGVTTAPVQVSEVADTIGAGDTFMAAVIDALWDDRSRPPSEVLAHAARAAAVTVSRVGADPPTRAELQL